MVLIVVLEFETVYMHTERTDLPKGLIDLPSQEKCCLVGQHLLLMMKHYKYQLTAANLHCMRCIMKDRTHTKGRNIAIA